MTNELDPLYNNVLRLCQEYSNKRQLKTIPRIIANARLESFEEGIYAALNFVKEYNQENSKKPLIEVVK